LLPRRLSSAGVMMGLWAKRFTATISHLAWVVA
jgi:hypothetical protein